MGPSRLKSRMSGAIMRQMLTIRFYPCAIASLVLLAVVVVEVPPVEGASSFLSKERQVAEANGHGVPSVVDSSLSTPQLIVALQHAEFRYQRRLAAQYLGERGEAETVPYLVRALEDPEEVVQKAAAESLVKLGGAEIFGELIERLDNSRESVRKYSAYVLGRLGTKENRTVVEALEKLAGDPDGAVRAEAFYALYEINSPSSEDIFVHGLRDKEPRVRSYAATALGNLKGKVGEKALINAFERETNEDVRRIMASALGKIGSAPAVSALVEALPNETPAVRADIAVALGETKTPETMEALTKVLSDPNATVRTKAAESLLRMNDPTTADALASALSDPAVSVRRPASKALVRLATKSQVDELIAALGDSDETVAQNVMDALIGLNDLDVVHELMEVIDSPNYRQAARALRVLEEITHRPYGSDIHQWKKWYQEYFKISG